MIRSLAATLILLVMMGALAVPVQADTTPVSGTLMGTSTLTPTSNPAVFDSSFTGSGVDSVSGPYTTTNTSIITFTSLTTFISTGTFVDVLAGGTTFGTLSGMGTVTATGSDTTVLDLITGGTGIFVGITGEITVTGTNTAGSFTGTYTGSITTVPEPGSLALLFAGMGFLLMVRGRIALGLRI